MNPLQFNSVEFDSSPKLWAKVLEFDYRPLRIGFALTRHWPSLVVLTATFLLAMALAVVAVSRRLRV